MLCNIKVIQAIDIDIIEEKELREIVRQYVQSALPPDANVRSIQFLQRKNPTRIVVKCDAIFGEVPVIEETPTQETQEVGDAEEISNQFPSVEDIMQAGTTPVDTSEPEKDTSDTTGTAAFNIAELIGI